MNWHAVIRSEFARLQKPVDESVVEEFAQHAAAASRRPPRRWRIATRGRCASRVPDRVLVPGDNRPATGSSVRRSSRPPPPPRPPSPDSRLDLRQALRLLAPSTGRGVRVDPHDRARHRRDVDAVQPRERRPPEAAAVEDGGPAGARLRKPSRHGRRNRVRPRADEHHVQRLGRFSADDRWRRRLARGRAVARRRFQRGARPLRHRSRPPCSRCSASRRSSVRTSRREDAGANNTVILSYGFWQERFGGARDVLGKQIALGGRSRTIIAVMPRGFEFPTSETRVWTPFELGPAFRSAEPQILDRGLQRPRAPEAGRHAGAGRPPRDPRA